MKQNTEKALKEKYITRTITWWEGTKVVANYEKRTFEEKPFVVFDELDIPRQAEKVVKHSKLYRMNLVEFIEHAEIVEE